MKRPLKLEHAALIVIALGVLLWIVAGCAGPSYRRGETDDQGAPVFAKNEDGTQAQKVETVTPIGIPFLNVYWSERVVKADGSVWISDDPKPFDWIKLAEVVAMIALGGPTATLGMGYATSQRVRTAVHAGKPLVALGFKHSRELPQA